MIGEDPWWFAEADRWTRDWKGDSWSGPRGLQPAWVAAVAAVEQDLGCWLYKGSLADLSDHVWELFLLEDAHIHMHLRPRAQSGWDGYFNTENAIDAHQATAPTMVDVADAIQGDLTGHHWIDWPSAGWSILKPEVVEGAAAWITNLDRRVIAPIGRLCERGTDPWCVATDECSST